MINEPLPQEIPAAHALILTQHEHIVSLEQKVNYLTEKYQLLVQEVFGRSSERRHVQWSSPAQQVLELGGEEVRQEAKPEIERVTYERQKASLTEEPKIKGPRFPAELPRVDKVIAPEREPGVEYEVIREEISERLGCNRIQFHVVREIRPVLKIKSSGKIVQSCSTAVLDRCAVEPSFIAQVIENKFCWHLPLYRQEQMLKAQGIEISRDSLIEYVIKSAGLLDPIANCVHSSIIKSGNVHVDETPVMVGKKLGGSKRYKQSYLWPVCSEDEISFHYAASRKRKELDSILKGLHGFCHADGYKVYETYCAKAGITLVCCMGHARREFSRAEVSDPVRVGRIIQLIGKLYEIEADIKDLDPPEKLKNREAKSIPILQEIKLAITEIQSDPKVLPKSQLLKACNYTTTRWKALTVYTTNGTLDIDNLPIERQIRYAALGRKNWLFCASELGAKALATMYSIVNSCRMVGIAPFHYLEDVLVRVQTHPASKVSELTPKNWKLNFTKPVS